jgi:hypothetical protein
MICCSCLRRPDAIYYSAMTSAPTSVVDALNDLLDAEANSIFRFVGEGSPYLDHATAEVRTPLAELDKLSRRHAKELAGLIESVGGVPRVRQHVRAEEQFLSFLSLKFLLPKLVTEKDLILTRYETAQKIIGPAYPAVLEAIARIEQEQRHYLDILQRVAHEITGGKYTAAAHRSPE